MDYNKVIDNFSRRVMGFNDELVFNYDKVVERYILLLDYYESLNFSFNYCTGYIIAEYLNDDLDTSKINEKAKENEHFSSILTSSSKIVERLNDYGEEEMASILGAYFYTIANAVYDFENSKEMGNAKIYS